MKAYRYKVFDRSKFTVVGTPNITDDGIASGFGASNYLLTPIIDFSKPWKISCVCTTSDISRGVPFSMGRNDRDYPRFPVDRCAINLSSLSIIEPVFTALQLSTTYKIEFSWDGSVYLLNVYNTDGTLYATTQASSTTALNNSALKIGYSDWEGGGWSGSIDLKQFSITVDGVEVFNGTKDAYKLYPYPVFDRSKFTVVGNPTITDDGIASGFSSTGQQLTGSYITSSVSIDFSKKWSILFKVKTGIARNYEVPLFLDNTKNNGCFVLVTPTMEIQFTAIESEHIATPRIQLSDETEYFLKIGWDLTKYYISASIDGITWTTKTVNSTTPIYDGQGGIKAIGCRYINSGWQWRGSIDLKQFSITVDEIEVFNGTKLLYKAFGHKYISKERHIPSEIIFDQNVAGTYTVNIQKEGDYVVEIVGAGGGSLAHWYSDTSNIVSISGTGGSGAYFKGLVHLKSGTYDVKIGSIGDGDSALTFNGTQLIKASAGGNATGQNIIGPTSGSTANVIIVGKGGTITLNTEPIEVYAKLNGVKGVRKDLFTAKTINYPSVNSPSPVDPLGYGKANGYPSTAYPGTGGRCKIYTLGK